MAERDRRILPRHAEGVLLRRFAASDLGEFQAYRSDPEVGRYQGWSVQTDAEAADFLARMSGMPLFRPGDWTQVAIVERAAQRLVGDIGIFIPADSQEAEIGFTLRREYQGRGLGVAAVRAAIDLVFEETNVERVLGVTDARNLPSIRLLQRVGMHMLESRQTEFRGEPCTEHVYALSR